MKQQGQRQQAQGQLSANAAVMAAYQAGDFRTALQALEGLKVNGQETGDYCFFRGSLERHLGDASAAEQWLRQALPQTKDPARAALLAESLGETLLELGRYEEARAAFQQSLQYAPQRSGSDRGIAETWLRQGEQLSTALHHAKTAVQKQRALAPGPAAHLNLGEDLALLAWAVAATDGEESRITALAEEAVAVCPRHASAPSAAQVNFHLGCAYAAIDRPDKSRHHFRETMELDPQGHWGVAAKRLRDAV